MFGPGPAVGEVEHYFGEGGDGGLERAVDGGVKELGGAAEAVDGDLADGPEEAVVDFVADLYRMERDG